MIKKETVHKAGQILVVGSVVGIVIWMYRMQVTTTNPYPNSAYKNVTEGPGPPGGVVVRQDNPMSVARTSMEKRELWGGATTQSYPLSRGF